MRRVRHALRPLVTRPLGKLLPLVLPHLYLAYMRIVWRTSRVSVGNFREVQKICSEHNGALGLLWHEEVTAAPYGYHFMGLRPHALASLSDAGDLITRILEKLGYVVFRGGSTTRSSRRREGVLRDIIEHLRTHDGVLYGLTVDGSKGPAYRLKRGGIVIARDCGKPILLLRTWYKRCIRLKTWDRSAIPLPFNRISYYMAGPFVAPPDAGSEEGFERFWLRIEDELIDLAVRSYEDMGQPRPKNLVKRPRSVLQDREPPA